MPCDSQEIPLTHRDKAGVLPWRQEPFRVRLEWGREGTRVAAERGDLLVVVDVLRFSTTVATAISRGGMVIPAANSGRNPQFTLSPLSYLEAAPGESVVPGSLNGAICSVWGRKAPCLLAGALVNARAVSRYVSGWLQDRDTGITILACGERWVDPGEDGAIRFAIEDYLGTGRFYPELRVISLRKRLSAPERSALRSRRWRSCC